MKTKTIKRKTAFEVKNGAHNPGTVKDSIESYFEMGMNGYVTKPINRNNMFNTINEVMGKDIHLPAED